MPFPLIPTALGVCFLLLWAFIGGMMFRDGQLALRRERDADFSQRPVRSPLSARRRASEWPIENRRPKRTVRVAS
jgi:hypothetical protein